MPKSRELPERGGLLVKNNIAAELTKYILPKKNYKIQINDKQNCKWRLGTLYN